MSDRPRNIWEGLGKGSVNRDKIRGRTQYTTQLNELTQQNRSLSAQLEELKADNEMLANINRELSLKNDQLMRNQLKLENQLVQMTVKQSSSAEASPKQKRRNKFANFSLKFQMHLKNRPSREELERKKIYQNEACFDNHLDLIEKDSQLTNVPRVLVECIRLLEFRPSFMDAEGLYRVSGNYATVQKIRFKIDSNNYKYLRDQHDPHALTGIVKLFLRELKQPLIDTDILANIKLSQMNTEDRVVEAKKLYHSMSIVFRDTIKYLILHLYQVVQNKYNGMCVLSLAKVMAPCICHVVLCGHDVFEQLNKFEEPIVYIQIMIERWKDIF